MKRFITLCATLILGMALSFPMLAASGPQVQRISLIIGKAETISLPVDVADILVADPGTVDVGALNRRKLYVVGSRVGETNVLLFDENKDTIAILDINVRRDDETLTAALKSFFPDEDVQARTINDYVVLSGRVSTPDTAQQIRRVASRFMAEGQELTDLMTVSGEQQVMLKVKIIEAQRTILREFGIEPGNVTNMPFGNFGAVLNTNAARNFDPTPYASASLLYQTGSRGPLELALQALEEDGLVNTLAEPTLTAVSGQTAQFLAGGEFPIPVGQSQGEVTIEFREFGVGLAFTPVVMSNNRIMLELETEVSDVSNQNQLELEGTLVPSLVMRRAETTVEMASGGSLMIAGLLQSTARDTLNQLPGVSKVPVLGDLFKSDAFQRDESELLILVTAYTVRPFDQAEAQRRSESAAGGLERASEEANRALETQMMQEALQRKRAQGIANESVPSTEENSAPAPQKPKTDMWKNLNSWFTPDNTPARLNGDSDIRVTTTTPRHHEADRTSLSQYTPEAEIMPSAGVENYAGPLPVKKPVVAREFALNQVLASRLVRRYPSLKQRPLPALVGYKLD